MNKLKVDRSKTITEMIVDFPESIVETPYFRQSKELLKHGGAKVSTWPCPNGRLIKWRRKVAREWDDTLNQYKPGPQRVSEDAFGMVVLKAKEFVQILSTSQTVALESHVNAARASFGEDKQLI